MEFWYKLDKAVDAKSRVLFGMNSGIELEGFLIGKDLNGNIELQTENKGIVNLFVSRVEYFSVLDNLTLIERRAKERGFV